MYQGTQDKNSNCAYNYLYLRGRHLNIYKYSHNFNVVNVLHKRGFVKWCRPFWLSSAKIPWYKKKTNIQLIQKRELTSQYLNVILY